MSNADYYFRTNDSPVIEETLDGNLAESGASVVFNMKPVVARGQSIVSDESVTVDAEDYDESEDVTHVSHQLDASYLSEADEYLAEFEATYADGEVRSFPEGRYYFIQVDEDLN